MGNYEKVQGHHDNRFDSACAHAAALRVHARQGRGRKKYELAGFAYDNISANTLGLSSEDVEYVFAAHRDASEDGSVAAAEIEIVLFVDEDKAQEYYDAKNADNAEAIEAGTFAVLMDGAFVLSGSPEAVEVF